MANSKLDKNGFEVIENVFSEKEMENILKIIESKELDKAFGIREFLILNPDLIDMVLSKKLKTIIDKIRIGSSLIKSIYFNKPPSANWIVNWHQDLTINVTGMINNSNFKNWRITKDRTVVQPPLKLLEKIFTIRIHLDNCTKKNGALRIVPKSHTKGVIPVKNNIESFKNKSISCEVNKGGILIMKPLLLHSSRRTENNLNRRVIHLEFCNFSLPDGIEWKEEINLN